jgi:hypothetical protein
MALQGSSNTNRGQKGEDVSLGTLSASMIRLFDAAIQGSGEGMENQTINMFVMLSNGRLCRYRIAKLVIISFTDVCWSKP